MKDEEVKTEDTNVKPFLNRHLWKMNTDRVNFVFSQINIKELGKNKVREKLNETDDRAGGEKTSGLCYKYKLDISTLYSSKRQFTQTLIPYGVRYL